MATLTNEQNQSLRIRLGGDAVNGWRLISLQPRSATIEGAGGTRTLELQPFNGQANKNANNPPENKVPTMVEHHVASPSSEAASAALVKPSTSSVSQSDRVPGGQQPAAVTGPQAPEKPIDAQIRAIRERIEARRRQLQQQQEQQK